MAKRELVCLRENIVCTKEGVAVAMMVIMFG
jgi:hypothetical protein